MCESEGKRMWHQWLIKGIHSLVYAVNRVQQKKQSHTHATAGVLVTMETKIKAMLHCINILSNFWRYMNYFGRKSVCSVSNCWYMDWKDPFPYLGITAHALFSWLDDIYLKTVLMYGNEALLLSYFTPVLNKKKKKSSVLRIKETLGPGLSEINCLQDNKAQQAAS